MNKNFSISEILESVNLIISDKTSINKKVVKIDNPDVEKIITDAEKSLKNKIKEEQNPLILDSSENLNSDLSQPLVLNNELLKESILLNIKNKNISKTIDTSYIADAFKINKSKAKKEEKIFDEEENTILEGNNLENLENNFIYKNKVLKSTNTKQSETIKDLNILLDAFKSKKRYADLDSKIKLFQDDNTILRKQIFELAKTETELRSKLSELILESNIKNKKD